MNTPALAHPVLFAAIRRDGAQAPNKAQAAVVGDYGFCLSQIEKWGAADGRNFVLGPLVDLLDFFVDPATPEAAELCRQAAEFERASTSAARTSLDASVWLRGGNPRDYGVLMRIAELAVAQVGLPAPVGERLQSEIGFLQRATERAH